MWEIIYLFIFIFQKFKLQCLPLFVVCLRPCTGPTMVAVARTGTSPTRCASRTGVSARWNRHGWPNTPADQSQPPPPPTRPFARPCPNCRTENGKMANPYKKYAMCENLKVIRSIPFRKKTESQLVSYRDRIKIIRFLFVIRSLFDMQYSIFSHISRIFIIRYSIFWSRNRIKIEYRKLSNIRAKFGLTI